MSSRLAELVSLEFDPLMDALAELERRALLESLEASAEMYAFHHAVVHRVVYSQISVPRRKLMHLRIARLLEGRDDPDGTISLELAHHASLGGDAALAARACVAAGTRCLRVFANAEAYTHARRGLRLVEQLPDPERVKLRIELEQISLGARWPEDPDAESTRIEALAEEALDAGCPEHARLGFTLVSTYVGTKERWGTRTDSRSEPSSPAAGPTITIAPSDGGNRALPGHSRTGPCTSRGTPVGSACPDGAVGRRRMGCV